MTLRELRTAKGWTVLQLSQKAQVSVNCIGNTERGVTVPKPSIYMRLCKALGVKSIDVEVKRK